MANRKATLIYYGNVLNVGWRRGPLVQSKNGKIKPGWLRYQGGDHQCTAGVYQIRHYVGSKVKHTPVSSDLDAAQTALTVFEKKLQYDALKQDLGIEMPDANKLERKTLAQLRKTYIEKYAHGSPDTIYNHTFNGTEFTRLLAERGKTYAEDVIEDDVIAYDRWLEARGDGKTTRSGRYTYLRCFLRHVGLDPNKVVSREWHIKLHRKPIFIVQRYSDEELTQLYAASSERHRLAWRCYRMLGFRDEELSYWEWDNIDWENKVAQVRFKPKGSYPWNLQLEWVSKDSEERDVPIPDVLLSELRAWREKNPSTRFVVGTTNDRPDVSFLKALKSDWRKAGSNCGKCEGCTKMVSIKRVTKGRQPGQRHVRHVRTVMRRLNECSRAKIKTFRATYLTTMLGYCKSSRDVQQLAGHSSLATTEKYLSPAATSEMQAAANAAFA